MTALEVAREVFGPGPSDALLMHVVWERTGFPSFFDGDPETTFRAQLEAAKKCLQSQTDAEMSAR